MPTAPLTIPASSAQHSICPGCGATVATDYDYDNVPGDQTRQHERGCLTHVENDLRALERHYRASATYADGCWAALNYRRDADTVRDLADLASAGQADRNAVTAEIADGLTDFHASLVSGREAASDSYSRASFGRDATRISALLELLTR